MAIHLICFSFSAEIKRCRKNIYCTSWTFDGILYDILIFRFIIIVGKKREYENGSNEITISNILNSFLYIYFHISAFLKKFLEHFAYFQTDESLIDNKTRAQEWSYDEYKLCGCETKIACKSCKITTWNISNNNNNNINKIIIIIIVVERWRDLVFFLQIQQISVYG